MDVIDVDGVLLCRDFLGIKDAIHNMEVRDSDVWICTFPRSGTTLMQETVWCIVNDLDFAGGAKHVLHLRCPYLESSMTPFWKLRKEKLGYFDGYANSVEFVNGKENPRVIKTHLPWHLLPKQIQSGERKPKIVHVRRNVKDVCISYMNLMSLMKKKDLSVEDYGQIFMQDKVHYSPYWKHTFGYMEQRERSNVLDVRYEDMRQDLKSELARLGEFLGKPLDSDSIDLLADHLSLESMKRNPSVNNEQMHGPGFIRSGTVGGHSDVFSEELNDKFDQWIADNARFIN